MKIIISGGGTGGHIYPALTIADNIKKIAPDAEIIFVGTKEGLEKDIIPRYGYKLRYIEVAGFKRSLSFDTVRSFCKLFSGLKDAYKIINDEIPDLVIGTGGYVCGPVVFMAAMKKIPTCIQEQNAMPGMTNKILAHWVNKVFLGYSQGGDHFGGSSEKVYTGNPIREEILAYDRDTAMKELALDDTKKTILVSGGSRGARSINEVMLEVERALSGRDDVQVVHATGAANYDEYMSRVNEVGGFANNIIVMPYLHNMPAALAVADIAVFRAGAVGLAELTAKGIPSILVPYPYATANHQEFNARAVEIDGAAKVVLDRELSAEKILEIVEHLLLHEEQLLKMHEAALQLGRPAAASMIAEQALALINK